MATYQLSDIIPVAGNGWLPGRLQDWRLDSLGGRSTVDVATRYATEDGCVSSPLGRVRIDVISPL